MTAYRMNDAPVLDQINGHYMKLLALVVWKLAPAGVQITSADILKFQEQGGTLFTHGHPDSFEFKIVTPAEAEVLAAHESATNRGTA